MPLALIGSANWHRKTVNGILLLGTFRISPFFWVALIMYKSISHFCCVVCFILRRKSAWILNYMCCKYMYFWRWHRIIDNVKTEGVSFTGEYSGINESPLNGNLKGGCCSSKLSKWSDCSLMFFLTLLWFLVAISLCWLFSWTWWRGMRNCDDFMIRCIRYDHSLEQQL